MREQHISFDYLIIGAGAAGMAFADSVLTDSDATMVIVDRQHRPGGHWNDAYPFVRLHQPASTYGVESRPLGSGRRDVVGLNRGLLELASGHEVMSHFDLVMQQRFLPSGRVRYFPMSEVVDEQRIVSSVSGEVCEVQAATIVDAAHSNMTVPATHVPQFSIGAGVTCLPPNLLPRAAGRFQRFVVIGGGKTGMDTCLWLLENGATPEHIRWIMPRDSWLFNRRMLQPAAEFLDATTKGYADQMEALACGTSVDDVFFRLERADMALRIDPTVTPTGFHCAIVSEAELEELRRITNIIRLGRVGSISDNELMLDRGTVSTTPDTLHIDCSAVSIPKMPTRTVFEPGRITLQWVRMCQPTFSASLIGHVEATVSDVDDKNRLCAPIAAPESPIDYLSMSLVDLANAAAWEADPRLTEWMAGSRLEGWARLFEGLTGEETEVLAQLERIEQFTSAAPANIERLLAAASATESGS
ncbi:MAG: NAD(P)-binding protein [Ilumatobacteraceae bacterium]